MCYFWKFPETITVRFVSPSSRALMLHDVRYKYRSRPCTKRIFVLGTVYTKRLWRHTDSSTIGKPISVKCISTVRCPMSSECWQRSKLQHSEYITRWILHRQTRTLPLIYMTNVSTSVVIVLMIHLHIRHDIVTMSLSVNLFSVVAIAKKRSVYIS